MWMAGQQCWLIRLSRALTAMPDLSAYRLLAFAGTACVSIHAAAIREPPQTQQSTLEFCRAVTA